MLTNKQSNLLKSLGDGPSRGAPHLAELAECLSDAFGGPRALAQMLHELANDQKRPDWLRTRAYGMVVNTISSASKLVDGKGTTDIELLSDDDLRHEAVGMLREALGVSDTMDSDLAALVAAWPELSAETRGSIVAKFA
jgi:hypothetical protein